MAIALGIGERAIDVEDQSAKCHGGHEWRSFPKGKNHEY